jgi:hypothetical protein
VLDPAGLQGTKWARPQKDQGSPSRLPPTGAVFFKPAQPPRPVTAAKLQENGVFEKNRPYFSAK